MANIIPLDKARHREAQLELPWYAAGELSAPERARFEAHLSVCAECQADLQFERLVRAEYPRSTLDVEQGWAAAQDRLNARISRPAPWRAVQALLGRIGGSRLTRTQWFGAALAVQTVLLVALVAVAAPRWSNQTYRPLGAEATSGQAAANIVVMFDPAAPEQDLRATLNASDARVVDGPSAANAYFLRVPPEERAAALETLRASAAVASAEPIDAPP